MPGESNFGRLYDALKTDPRISTDLSREDFISAMEAPGDKGYHNRLGLFNSLKTEGFTQFNTYEEFAAGMGLHAVSKPKANVGNKDTQVRTFAPASKTAKPQQRSQQKQQQSKASKPTAAQNAAMADWAGQAMMDVARGVQRTNKVLDYQSRKAKSPLNVSRVRVGGQKSQTQLLQNNNVVEGDQKINPDSGELEQTYLTSDGGEYTNRYTADMAQNQLDAVDHMIYLEEHPEEYLLQEKSRIENEMRARAQELEKEEESNGSILRNLAQGSRSTFYTNNGRYSDQKYTSLMAQMKQVDEALETLRAAKEGKKSDEWIKKVGDYAEQKWGKYNPLTWAAKIGANVNSFLEGSWRGFVRNVGKVGTWDMGFTDALSAGSLYTSAIDNEKGKAQKEQKDLLNVAALSNKVKQENEQYLGRGYKAGEVTATSLPFMIEMMLNPASGMGQAAQRTTMRYCIKRFGAAAVREATKNYIKKFAFKYGARLTGDAVGSAVMAATTGQVHVVADQLRRMTGDIQYTIDSQGNVVYGGRTNAEDNPFKAYAKAFGAQAIENHSEMLGEYFAPVLGKAGSLLNKGLTKATSKNLYARFGVQKIRNFIAEASHSNIGSFITNLEKRAKWNGTIGEYAEEVAGNIENAILVGDNTLDTDENTGVFNLDQNIDTFLGVALMGGFISTVKTAQYAYGGAKREAYNNMNDVSRRIDRAFAGNFNSMQMWGKWRNTLLVGTDEEKKQTLRSVLDNKELPMAARMAVLDYAKAAQTYQGICMAQATKRASRHITATGRVGQSVDDANEEGYQATNEEKNAIRRDYRSKRKRLLRVFGEEAKSIEGQNDQELTELYGKLVDEKRSLKKCEALYDYMQSKARYYGMIERAQDDIDDAVDESNRAIDSHANQNGMIQKATLKADGRQVFIVSGNVSLTEDGEKIDTNKSDQSLVIVDAQTGKREMIAPSALQSVDEPIDAAKLKQDEEARIRGEKSQQEADVIDGKLAFNVGDEYGILDYNGKTSRVKVLEDKGETVLVYMDGRQVEVTKKQVQQMYDDFMQSQSDAETEQAANENGLPPYGFSDEFDFTDKDGKVIHGEIQGINEDGVEIRTDIPYNGQIVQVIPKGDFENMITNLYREGNEVWNKSRETNNAPTWGVGSRIEINGYEYKVLLVDEENDFVSLEDESGKYQPTPWSYSEVERALSDGRARIVEEDTNIEPKPIGKGVFGNIYDQFKGKAKAAIDFLKKLGSGEAVAALHHKEVGDISLVWGNDKAGLKKILRKHPEVVDNLQGILDGMHVVQSSENRIILESDTHKAVVSREFDGTPREQWLLTAYEKKNASGGSIDIVPEPTEGKQNGTAPLQDNSSADKVTEQSSTTQAEAQENAPMPMRTVGKGKNAREEEDWLATSPERGHDYIFSESGLDAETANTFVENKLSEAKKSLDKVKKNEPKIGTSIAEYKAAKQEHDARVAEAQKEVDYWNDVKVVHAKRAFEAENPATEDSAAPAVDSAHQVDERISQKWNDANKIDGDADEITLPNGESVKGHYVLTESGAASASHQATNGFSETEGFPVDENGQSVNDRDYKRDHEAQEVTRSMASDYDSRALQSPVVVSREGVVLSGNGRTMAGEIAAQNGTDKKYNDYLRTHANKYGFTEEQVNGYEHPRVLFVPDADMPYTAETFAKFNQREQKSQNKTEQAVKMGKVVDDALFGRVMQTIGTYDTLGEFYGDDAATHGVVKELAAADVIPQTEMAQLFDGGKLSDAGQAMVEGVLIGKVFQANPDAVREITEVKSMRQSVMAALQEIVTNSRLGGGYDLSQELAEAVDLVYKARKAGYKAGMRVSEYAGQGNLFQLEDGATVADYTNAAVMMLADVLNDGRTTQLKKVMAFYNRQAADAAQGIGDMFAGGVKTKEDIINEVNEALNNGQNYNRNAASASDGQSGGNEGGEQGDVASPGDQGGERGLREAFDGLAAKLKSAEGEERMRVLGEMRDGIARFAEENGYPVPEFLLTREDFLAAVPENDKARVEQWLNDGWHCPAYYEKGKVYYFVEGCDNFDKDILETLSHEYTHADNAEFPENVNALVYAVEDTHEVSQDELIDILETLSNSSHYETDAERLESEGKNPNKMLADEVIAHVVARMARDGEQVLDGITKNPTLQFIIKRAYKVRENERRHNILASEASERSSKTIESSEANSGNSQSVAEGESRLGRHGRSARSEVETGEQSSNGRSTVTVGEEVAAPSSEGAKDGVTDGEKSSGTGDAVPSGNGEKDNLRMQKADGKSAQPPTREETILRDAVIDHMKGSGLDVLGTEDGQRVLDMVNGRDVRLSAKQKRALETATIADESTNNATVVSSAAGAKVQNNLEILAEGYQKRPNKTKGFITDLSRSLGLKQHESSQYGTFVTGNGKTVTIRVSNHNARVSNFDRNGENDGISIVISSHKNKGLNNDGDAHVTEFFYSKQSLERAGSKPLSEVIRSFSEALNSGVFKDTTGLAERQEVNNIIIREHRVYHGSGTEFDAFDHSHMGEGEGAQAYGWGTYVTEVEGIGRTYAKKAVASNSVIHRVYRYLGNGKSATNAMMNPSTHKNTILRLIDKAIATREHILGGTTLDPLIETMKKELKELKVAKDLLTKEQQRILYTVEIPNDNGNNYLDWKGHPAESLLKDVGSFLESNGFEMVQDSPARYEKGESTIVLNPNATGADLYAELQEALGSDKKASQALAELGYTGIKYPADNMRGGREDGAKNYVIFNEKDAKITDHVRFFRTANGEAYGFTVGGKIYIDPKIANSETPVHEYAHLWASALKANNPKEWQNVVNLMKGTSVWAEVKKAYPELKTDDEIADEVLATYSGRRGAERLREEAKKISDGEGSVFDKAKAVSAMERVRQAIEKFWKAVADFLHIHYTSAEQVADQVMKDLLNGVDPRKFMGEKAQKEKMRYQFIGEQGAERADHAEEVTTRLDNLSVAREMEVAKKDAKAIKLATGWERGADGKWRYEIPDLKYFGKGDAGYKNAREKQPWSKELDGLSDRIFDGEELSESEYQRFDELSQEEENFKKDYLNREKPHLADWVENDELFKAYPDLKRVKLVFTDQLPANMGGSYNERDHTIVVNTNYVGDIASVLAHEVQHAIQKIEGFARGGNPESMQERFDAAKEEWRARAWADALRDKADEMGENYNQAAVEKALIDEYKEMGMDNDEWMPNKETRMKGFNYFARGYADRSLDEDIKNFRLNESTRSEFSPYVEYTKLGGEVESRNVEHRMNMTPEERMASLAAETEDVSREDQIFLMSGDGGNANSEMPQESGTEDDYSEFAKEHGVDADVVKDYASGMKTGNLQKADMALAEIRRTMRVANRGMKLSEFGKLFRPVQKELAERYGDIETLRQEHIDATMRERGVMEAARKRADEEEAKRKAHLEDMSLLTTEELDKRYFDAIESGDDAAAREMLDEAARRKGYDDTESNYQGVGAWSAPSNPGYESDAARRADVEDNAPDVNIEDIALGYSLVDEKYWQEPRKYMQTDATAIESVNAIREAIAAVRRGEKNVKVKVYRAVPTSVKEGKLRNGDWVTPSKDYAKMHGEHRLEGKYRIIEDEVSVDELWWDGNDSREWGFDNGKGYKYKNVENSRKSDDLVTRDDNGEIIPPSKRFDENVEDVRYRTSEELNQINQKFNERLDELVSNPNQKDKVLHLGRSSQFLKDGGISDAEIVLDYDKLVRKSKEGYKHEHPFDVSDVRDLPRAIASPIAVFDNTNGKNDGKVILTELKKDGRNFIVAIQTANLNRKGGKVLEVNKIVTLFPKDARGVINWFNIGKATNIDKKKALHFIEALLNHPETTITNEELSTAAKVVKDFETLQLSASEKAKQQAANDLARQLHVEGDVEVVTTTEGLTGRQAKAKGWYDVRTGKVTIVLPNNKNAADVRETVFHEVVTHKGLRSLVGDENFNTFLDNVYNNAEEKIQQSIDELSQKYGGDKRKATEEYMAGLAEDGEFAKPENQSFFRKVKDFLVDLLRKVGIKLGFKLTDNDLRYILWRSWKNLKSGGRPSVFDQADTVVMREKTGFGKTEFSDDEASRRSENNIETINANFNEELQQQIDGKLLDGHIYKMGNPGRILLSTGVPNLPIQMNAKRLQAKATSYGHDFDLSEVKDLVKSLQQPLAIFAYGDKSKAQNIIVPLQKDENNFIVGLSLNPMVGGRKLEINSIRNVFPKNNSEWLNWISQGKALYMDKEKIQTLIDQQRTILADVDYLDLDSIAKVVENFENPTTSDEINADNDLMFRDGDDVEYDKAMARDIYEKRVSRGLFQTQEAIQDSMLGLKEAMNAILKAEGKKMYIEEIPGYENPYLGENRLSSVSQAECTAFAHTLFKPLLECVAEMAPTKAEREQLTDYMMAKHGLERNEVMAKREAQKLFDEYQKKHPQGAKTLQDFEDKCRERDYAGLTALTGTDNVTDAETKAKQMVDDYESKKATSRLWWLTNKVNDAILTKTYESGIISKDTYDDIKSMYDYYIPLRGFDEKTGEETYAYLSNRTDGGSGSAIRRANGRRSKADDPFANMQSMAESAIMQGNRNTLVKQKFLNFALNHPSDLVSVSDLWLWHNDATDEWQAIHPGDIQGTEKIKEDDSPAEVERKIRDFETAIEQAAQNDPDHYMKQKDRPDIPYRVVESSDERQHQVIAKRNGIDYVMIINGNPRAAQALNGQTNPDNDVSGAIGALMNVAQAVNRQLSAFYTTRNPDFVVSNFVRDALYANTFTWVKESPNYALRFHKNFARVNPVKLAELLYKFNEGILDKNDELERMFSQFMMNGGETGYTNVRDIEKHKTDINRELKKYSGGMSIRKGLDLLGENFDLLNRSVENCARFAAFVTSRQMGRSLDRSIYDAKEISVNFNKKGSGAKFMGANGQTFLGNSASFVSGLGRSFYVFWNAAIQGTTNFGRQFGRHPVKAIAGAATMFLLGALMAGIGGSGGDGDDGEGNSYYDLPDFVRRSNILFRFPWQKKSWVSIPLPTEYRAIYGMGELMMSLLSGKVHYTDGELATQIAGQFTQILPLDILEGGGLTTMLPSYLKPVVEVMSNKAWTGMPIYKDSPFNKDMPEWTKAYSSANKYIVGFSKVLNEWTGGDNYTKGWADLNPAKIEYMLGSYFGGFFTTVDKLVKMAETALGDREYDPKSMLVVNRLIKQGDERTEFRAINNEYFRIKEESEKLETRLRNYERDTASGVFNYAEKIHQLNNAPGYQILEAYKNAEMDLNNIDTELSNQSLTNEERAQLEELQNIRKKELVEQVNDIRKGKKYTPKSASEGQVQEMLSVYTKFKKKINEINKLKDTNLDEYSRQWQILTSDPNYIVYVIANDYKSDISALTKKFANSKTQKERKAAADSMISTRNRYLELLNDAKQGK